MDRRLFSVVCSLFRLQRSLGDQSFQDLRNTHHQSQIRLNAHRSDFRTLCSKVSFSRTRSPVALRLLGILLIACTGKPTNEISPLPYSSLPSMKSPKPKRISYVKAGVLIVDQVKPALL